MSFKQLETLNPVLARIDELQEQVNEAKEGSPDAYDRVMESWAIESTYNSNNIEGSTLSLGDTALLYSGVQVDGPAEGIRQAEGGFAALRFLRSAMSERQTLSEALIKRAHELVFAEAKDPAMRGTYRTVEVEITGTDFQPAPSVYVPERMAGLVEMCTGAKRHPAIVAALFHLEFESIHPFVNANGRTGRLISNYLLMSAGYEPVNIQAESRARYIAAIRAFQENDDPYPFVAFFCLNLAEHLEKVLSLFTPNRAGVEAPSQSGIAAYLDGKDEWNHASARNKTAVVEWNQSSPPSSLDLAGWNTSKVEDMSGMLNGCESLVSLKTGPGWRYDALALTRKPPTLHRSR